MTATLLRLPVAAGHGVLEPLLGAGLLAGLGAQAEAAVAALAPTGPAPTGEASQHTCVDAGGSLVLAVDAPGQRALHAEARAAGAPGTAYWHGLRAEAGQPPRAWRRWRTVTFAGEPAGAFTEVLGWAEDAGLGDEFRVAHATLGPRAHLFTASDEPARDELWTGWRLDTSYRPGEALCDLGYPAAWPAALSVLRRLLGDGLAERSRPWAVLLPLHAPPGAGRVRLATTIWSRIPEDATKHRRLAEVVGALGGDGPFAEALYKLLAGAGPGPVRGLGRALLVELEGGEPVGLQALLSADLAGAGLTRKD